MAERERDDTPAHTNRLADETSLYLRQHMHNPVDWYPWDEAAFEKAREEDKPLFLSIGYSACHWCHVMERESFEDEATAKLLNENFVSIKVDREERPDVDQIYMNFVQLVSGRGGWPLNVFLHPDGRPMTGGTYFPPERRYGMPSFKDVLRTVADAWENKRDALQGDAERVLVGIRKMESLGDEDGTPRAELLDDMATKLAQRFDAVHGGFSEKPKFPNPAYLEALLTHSDVREDERSLDMVKRVLSGMARGGIYDHLGGGFHRYSVDEKWLVPHFEKMLYDNAQLLPLYLEIYRRTGDESYGDVARETFDYLMREMRAPDGRGYYATQDADSEGVEGKFFVWTPDEIQEVLGEERGGRFCIAYGVTRSGNFEEGKSVLHTHQTLEDLAQKFEMSEEEIERELEASRLELFEAREERVKPARDEKRIAGWNGLVMRAFARGAMILGDEDLRREAVSIAEFVDGTLLVDGALKRIHAEGQTRIDAFLEDHAFIAWGLLDVFRLTGDDHWLGLAQMLCETMASDFYAADDHAFHVTAERVVDEGDDADDEGLIVRPVALYDSATPSGGTIAISCLLQVAHLTDDDSLREVADAALRRYLGIFEREPRACTSLSESIALSLEPPVSVVLAGPETAVEEMATSALREAPPLTDVIRVATLSDESPVAESHTLSREARDGRPTAYVCQGTECSAPVHDVEALVKLL